MSAMVQSVEKLPDIHIEDPSTDASHCLRPKLLKRLVRRAFGPETVRAFMKKRLVQRFQQHYHRALKDLVLQRGDIPG